MPLILRQHGGRDVTCGEYHYRFFVNVLAWVGAGRGLPVPLFSVDMDIMNRIAV